MTDFTEKVRQNALVTFIVVLVASIIITLAILLYTGLIQPPFAKSKTDVPITDADLARTVELIQNVDDKNFIKQISGESDNAGNYPTFTSVKLPLLLAPEYEAQLNGVRRGCDLVYMIEKQIPATPAPLNASYRELFAMDDIIYSELGNFITRNPDLNFEKATIDNGLARVYLTGKLAPIGGVCDEPRLRIQIEETAFQFNTVRAVEIYLNGVLY